MRSDPSFAQRVAAAKSRHIDEEFQSLDSALNLFCEIVYPLVTAGSWPRIRAELAIAVANLKHGLKEDCPRKSAVPSGKIAEVSLSPLRFGEVAVPNRGNGTSARIFMT